MWQNTTKVNLDPIIHRNGKILMDWCGWCLLVMQNVYGVGWSAPDAWQAWEKTPEKYRNRNFPSGVFVPIYFDGYWQGKRYGHIAMIKDGVIYSSPWTRKPYLDKLSSIAEVERIYGMKYVGWSPYVGQHRVVEIINKKERNSDMNTIKSMFYRLLGREADSDGIKHYQRQVKDKGWEFVYNDLKNSEEGQADWQKRNPERVRALENTNKQLTKKISELHNILETEKTKPKEIVKEIEKVIEVPIYIDKVVEVEKKQSLVDLFKSMIDKIMDLIHKK